MNAVLALSSGPLRAGRVPGRGIRGLLTPAGLAVLAFAVMTTFGLSVVGGLMGFMGRAQDPSSDLVAELAPTYVILAWIAVVLLLVPLVSLGGAAARLGVARRDARLATLRLLGVTPREVIGLTVVETAGQGLLGAALGFVGYLGLMPVWTRIPFMDRTFTVGELWVGPFAVLVALAAVPLLAAVSGMVSLRRVVISPLGVAMRQTPARMRWLRMLAVLAALGAFVAYTQVSVGFEEAVAIGFLLGLLAVVFGTLNLLGPWTISVLGRVMARTARTVPWLLAARRLLDDPRAAWRVVGGLSLASFVAGVLSVLPGIVSAEDGGQDAQGAMLLADLVTGAILTLAIAFTAAACSAGIVQAATVLDRRREYALQQLAGVPVELFDAVRRREVLTPLIFVSGTSALVAIVVLVPLFGTAAATAPQGLLALAACLGAGVVLVLAATETSRPLLRSVLRETVVRAD
ncbi:FtsX-like permease family protein [Cellulomonas sp. KRMCY2]|uniref:FtsX-like permease family protein n=1 Tax=Cellulomonas sp. KRMCY2 TaxID=1304865 RepID=UPI00045E7A6D|nr:FtsX-like permease family protein [Cellulomonas sp. KRMCY2]